MWTTFSWNFQIILVPVRLKIVSNAMCFYCYLLVCLFIESLQCRRRPFGWSSLHRPLSHPGPIPVTPHNPPDTRVNLAWPVNLTLTSLDYGRKPEHPEETHADKGRTWKVHTDSDPSRESNPGPWRCEAAVLTTVPPCHPCAPLITAR